VPDQKIHQVHFPQVVVLVPMLLARGLQMLDLTIQLTDRPGIGLMIVAVYRGLLLTLQNHLQQLFHAFLDGFGVRSAEFDSSSCLRTLLLLGHGPFSAHLTVGEVQKKSVPFSMAMFRLMGKYWLHSKLSNPSTTI
jgi:hypothetical protein